MSGIGISYSLPLHILLYFNIIFTPPWIALNMASLNLKFHYVSLLLRVLYTTVFITSLIIELVRLYLGYIGRLREKVSELLGSWLLTLIQFVILLFLVCFDKMVVLPMELVANGFLICFIISESIVGFYTIRMLSKQQAAHFHLKHLGRKFEHSQFKLQPQN